MKLVATIVSYTSGNAGGIFAPSLYIGAMAGGALGTIVHAHAPFPTADPGAYALVGMGTLFAGIIRAPMTSVFMIFEITQDYQILVPLMVANMLSFMISRRFQPTPVYHALLRQDNIHLPAANLRGSGTKTAATLMRPDGLFLVPSMPVSSALQTLRQAVLPAAPVGSREHLVGVITCDRLESLSVAGHADVPVGSVVGDDAIVHVHPDHPLDVVLDRFAEAPGVLPVVSRSNARRVEGLITLDRIVGSGRHGG
jgi:CIC family chloride channel protein